MEEKKNWSAMSIVCVVQTIVCGIVLLAILFWKVIGGSAYEAALDWYVDNASDTVLVYPAESELMGSAVSDG